MDRTCLMVRAIVFITIAQWQPMFALDNGIGKVTVLSFSLSLSLFLCLCLSPPPPTPLSLSLSLSLSTI